MSTTQLVSENYEDNLRRVAKDLRRTGSGGYWSTFCVADLMEWLRKDGICTYCGNSIVDKHHVTNMLGTWDHLLPKVKYPELENHPLNRVPCCTYCNSIKRDWDPNAVGSTLLSESKNNEGINERV